MVGLGVCADANTITEGILDQNFPSGFKMGVLPSDLASKYPDLLKRNGKTRDGRPCEDLIYKINKNKFYCLKSVDGVVRAIQLFEKHPRKPYLFEKDSIDSSSLFEHFSMGKRYSLRMTDDLKTFKKPVTLLVSKHGNLDVAFSSDAKDKNLIIFDRSYFSFEDFFASPQRQQELNERLKKIRLQTGSINNEDKSKHDPSSGAKLMPADKKAAEESYLFSPENRIRKRLPRLSEKDIADGNIQHSPGNKMDEVITESDSSKYLVLLIITLTLTAVLVWLKRKAATQE